MMRLMKIRFTRSVQSLSRLQAEPAPSLGPPEEPAPLGARFQINILMRSSAEWMSWNRSIRYPLETAAKSIHFVGELEAGKSIDSIRFHPPSWKRYRSFDIFRHRDGCSSSTWEQ